MTRDGTVRWGLLGAAKITEVEMGPALLRTPRCRAQAVASRRVGAARALAERLGAPSAYGSYEELLADPAVDAVYNALPNALHKEWTVKALAAGKHVLCEKPMGMTAEEVREMADAARAAGRVLMEGFMWRFHPRVARVRELVDGGRVGQVRLVRTTYTFDLAAAGDVRSGSVDDDIRLDPTLGGGALTDLGSYCVSGLRVYARSRPTRAVGHRSSAAGRRVETQISGEVTFAGGVVGQFFAALDLPGGGHVEILGTGGRIRMANAFRIRPSQGPFAIEISTPDGTWTQEPVPYLDQYELELQHFVSVLLDGADPMVTLEDSLENARTLEAIRSSWTDGPVDIAGDG
ncbi:Gfo/Idh/MocA family protein [Georgenia sp. AZ-5]|uniref:Gfo/Idh/MocA family protein n=1 Tax=Georgenia sp. AZ-5 TaxID=3367526 RepID=UPI0037544521